MRRTSWIAGLLVVALLAGSCGDDETADVATGDGPSSASDGPDHDESDLPPFCDDVEPPGPIAEGNLAGSANPDPVLMGVLQTYQAEHPETAAGLWIDRPTGTVVLAFTDDPDVHLATIEQLRPSADDQHVVEPPPEITETTTVAEGDQVVDVVQVRYSMAELEEIQDDVVELVMSNADLGAFGAGRRDNLNRVSIDLQLADQANRAALAEILPIGAICVSGPAEPPETVDPDEVRLISTDDDPLVSCGTIPFRLSALDGPLGFENEDHPVAEALRAELESGNMMDPGFDVEGWRLLAADDDRALVAGGDPVAQTISFERRSDVWVWSGSGGGCRPRLVVEARVSEARWGLDPDHPAPGPGDTTVQVLVSEMACTSGQEIGDRLIGPQIRYTDDEVQIAFAAVPLEGGAFNCPGNPPTVVTVELDEPLGERALVDALDAPPREPVGTNELW